MTNKEPSEGFWSTRVTADYLDVPEATLRFWVYSNKAPRSYKLGRHRKFKPADVRAWAEARASTPAA